MEIQIVEFFKSWSCKFCDLLFSFTNILGEDLFFYLVFFILYWCYDRRFALKYSLVYLGSCASNVLLKKLIGRPRPIGATATGKSFPSGHAQSYASVGTGLLYEANKHKFPAKRWQRIEFLIEFIVFGVLVAIGRMYFGQHYLTDVVAGLLIGAIITILITYVVDIIISKSKISLDKFLLILVPIVAVAYVVVACTNIFDAPDDLAKIYRMVGIFFSVVVGHFVDKKWIKYSCEDTMKNRLLKAVFGSATLMMIFSLWLREVEVNALLPVYYFVVGLVGTVVLPWIFKTIKNEG